MTKKTEWFVLTCVLLLAAILRVQAVSTTQIDHPIRADAQQYYFSSLNLQRWHVFSGAPPASSAPIPDAARPPLMPALLEPFVVFPPTDAMLFHFNLLQVFLDVLTVVFTFFLFRLVTGAPLALAAAALIAICPHLISMTTYLLTETSFTFFLTAGVCLLAYGLNRECVWCAVLGGLLLGFSALTRETTEYLPFFMLISLFWFLEKKLFARVLVPAAVAALAVVFAWKLRNLSAIGALSDPALAVRTIHHGMYPDMMYNNDPYTFPIPYQADPQSAQMTTMRSVLSILWQRSVAEPLHYLHWYLIGKPMAFLQWDFQEADGDVFLYPVTYTPFSDKPLFIVTHAICRVLHAPLVLAAFLGAILALWRPRLLGLAGRMRLPVLLMVCVMAYFVALHTLGFPLARYSVPLRPCMYGFGLFTLVKLLQMAWRSYQARKA